MAHDLRYLSGIALFNNQDYFEAHEEWEALWHDTHDASKDFYRGLVQVTSAFHHFRNGNLRGARILHDSGIELLSPYGDFFQGIDLKELRELFNRSFREIAAAPLDALDGRGHPGPVKVPFTPERVFPIKLHDQAPR